MVYKSVRNEDLKLSRQLREVYFCIGYSVFISVIGYSTNLKQTQNHKQNKTLNVIASFLFKPVQ